MFDHFQNGAARAQQEIANKMSGRFVNAALYKVQSQTMIGGAWIGGITYTGPLDKAKEWAAREVAKGEQKVEILGPNGFRERVK